MMVIGLLCHHKQMHWTYFTFLSFYKEKKTTVCYLATEHNCPLIFEHFSPWSDFGFLSASPHCLSSSRKPSMTAIIPLPVATRSLLSYRHCFSICPLTPANTFSTTAAAFSVSLQKRCSHQTLASVSPKLSTFTTSLDRQFSRNVVDILEQRGLIESITSENLRSACSMKGNHPPVKVYCGFDPTAESLHLGNLIGIIVLSWFQRCGHKPVAVLGGATGRVGDPSGKSTERPVLDDVTLEKNIGGIKSILNRILSRFGDDNFVILNNYDWWKDVSFLDFLKNVGKFARVGAMMSKESVRKRLESEQGISFTEFSYQLLQGYDFLHLYKNEGISVQIGGSDQWGNITAGTELIRKVLAAEGAYGLTFPLLLKSDGTKFGKSEEGAVWLSPALISPYKFYQYFFTVPDSDVVRFFRILTFLDIEEIAEIEKEMKKPEYVPNSAQRRLAEELTYFVHGEEGLKEAIKATEALRPGAETQLDWKTIEGIAKDVPSCSLAYDDIINLSIVDLSVLSGLLESKSAVRRMLKQGGLYLNNSRVDSESKMIAADDIVDGKVLLLSAGKKNKMVVRIA